MGLRNGPMQGSVKTLKYNKIKYNIISESIVKYNLNILKQKIIDKNAMLLGIRVKKKIADKIWNL